MMTTTTKCKYIYIYLYMLLFGMSWLKWGRASGVRVQFSFLFSIHFILWENDRFGATNAPCYFNLAVTFAQMQKTQYKRESSLRLSLSALCSCLRILCVYRPIKALKSSHSCCVIWRNSNFVWTEFNLDRKFPIFIVGFFSIHDTIISVSNDFFFGPKYYQIDDLKFCIDCPK